ncbi:MAG: single-stranded DNA-binding protein [Chthoniobacterales bacterium]
MASLNKVQIIGNITRDPEIKYTPKGTAVIDLGIAMNRTFTSEAGEKREEVTFVDVTFWGRQAEVIAEYCKKGNPIYSEGRLQLDSWEDKTSGQKRTKLRIIGESFQFLGSRSSGSGNSGNYEPGESSARPSQEVSSMRAPRPAAPAEPIEDDDVPF